MEDPWLPRHEYRERPRGERCRLIMKAAEQGDATLHTPRSEEGERTVEALHDGAQHREGGRRGNAVTVQARERAARQGVTANVALLS